MKLKSVNSSQIDEKIPVAESGQDNQQLIEGHRKAAKHHEAAARHHHQAADQHEKNFRISKEIHEASGQVSKGLQ